ncbi:sigma 54-interacting transcriptional regulator [Peribacillus muralis]|uniref:sigma 54-interacting transcriptional regulator n=1 Tax=Peribacillus muralis TaxID=264697 RepID=UPI000710D1E0|nr:sigma 54-interacting transcriptional regulator [Peribacillus muralis]
MRIGIISTYPAFTSVAQEVTEELGLTDVVIEHGTLNEGAEIAIRWEREKSVDAIIVRSLTYEYVQRSVSLPCISMEISNYDLLEAFYKARKFGGQVAVIYPRDDKKADDLQHFARVANIEITPFFYTNRFGWIRQTLQAKRQGYNTVVSFGRIIELAQHLGMRGIIVEIERETLRETLKQTKSLLRINQSEQVKARRKQETIRRSDTILKLSTDGVISINSDSSIIIFNPAAEKLLNINAKDIIGLKRKELENHPVLGPLLKEDSELEGELMSLAGINIVVNRRLLGKGNMVVSFQTASHIQTLEGKIRKNIHAKGLVARYKFNDLIGNNSAFQKVVDRGIQFAKTDFTVLLTGESGTGKELFAHSIHQASGREKGPFIAINCAALPESLLESELFGYEEGAFTGARKGGKLGHFELAHRGTIFLDEIGEMSVVLQARLLRVLQDREVMRVGGDKVIPVDVRIIAATNRNLLQSIEKGQFREDLYYRLNVLTLRLPSLGERFEDIPLLAERFLEEIDKTHGLKSNLPESWLHVLQQYHWPGNVRELKNFVQRCVVLTQSVNNPEDVVTNLLHELMMDRQHIGEKFITVEKGTLAEMENQIIRKLDMTSGYDRIKLAKFLGISRTTLWTKLKEG